MDAAILFLLLGIVVALAALGFVLIRVVGEVRSVAESQRQSAQAENETPPALVLLQNQVEALREQVRSSLDGGRTELDRRLAETNRIVGDVHRGLGQVDRQVRSVGETADQLRDLQELLRSPKVRGGIGEQLLQELLAQVLPKAHYALQHRFSGGEQVDAIIRLGDHLVPVDAKFPMDNFRRAREASREGQAKVEQAAVRAFRGDVRKHVDAIAQRYIRPEEGTFEFALMYIPAEAIYQEVTRQDSGDGLDLLHYAMSRKVVAVSPQSFYAYLQVIVLGLRGLSIEQRAREIMGRLGAIRNRLELFTESFDVATKHLERAQRQFDESGRRLARVDAAMLELDSASVEQRAAPDTHGPGRRPPLTESEAPRAADEHRRSSELDFS